MYHILFVCVCVIVCSLPPSSCSVLPTLVKSGRPNHHSWQISLHLAWRIVLILPKLNQPPLRISWAEPCESCTHNCSCVPSGNSVGWMGGWGGPCQIVCRIKNTVVMSCLCVYRLLVCVCMIIQYFYLHYTNKANLGVSHPVPAQALFTWKSPYKRQSHLLT